MEEYKGDGAMDKVSQKTLENQAAELSGRKGCISGSTLKIIALTVMLLDHAAVAILGRILIRQGYLRIMLNTDPAAYAAWQSENMCILVLYWAMRLIGRLGFPIFCFLLIEGVRHTQNKVKYALRLGCFALISEIPFDLAIRGEILEFSYQNVFFTLFLGMVALCAYDFLDSRVIPAYLQSVCLFGGIFVFGMYVTFPEAVRMVYRSQGSYKGYDGSVLYHSVSSGGIRIQTGTGAGPKPGGRSGSDGRNDVCSGSFEDGLCSIGDSDHFCYVFFQEEARKIHAGGKYRADSGRAQ